MENSVIGLVGRVEQISPLDAHEVSNDQPPFRLPFLEEIFAKIGQQVQAKTDPRGYLRRIQIVGLFRPAGVELANEIEPLAASIFNRRGDVEGRPTWIARRRREEHFRLDVNTNGGVLALDPIEGELRPQLRIGLRVCRAVRQQRRAEGSCQKTRLRDRCRVFIGHFLVFFSASAMIKHRCYLVGYRRRGRRMTMAPRSFHDGPTSGCATNPPNPS